MTVSESVPGLMLDDDLAGSFYVSQQIEVKSSGFWQWPPDQDGHWIDNQRATLIIASKHGILFIITEDIIGFVEDPHRHWIK